jgi:bifunctional non-homologous end joining protein LigD
VAYPEYIRPMEPRRRDEPFTDPGYVYQIKWDGVRYLAFISSDGVRLQNRRLRIKTHLYPELTSLTHCLGAGGGVLDGEIIAMGEGGTPSFPQVLRRDLVKEVNPRLQLQVPVYFMAFDLLYLGEKNIMGLPMMERFELLKDHLQEGPALRLTENHSDGRELFEIMADRGMEGMVAKKKEGPYRAGQKTEDWLKVKVPRFQDCLVGGYALKAGRVSSLLVGAYQGQDFLYLGRVSSGLKEAELGALHRELYPHRREVPPFFNAPKMESILKAVWLEPTLGVKVQYAEWTPDLKLRAPRVKGFIPYREGDWNLK